jgi:hypothetical protein
VDTSLVEHRLDRYGEAMPIAHFSLAALDCPDPLALAEFYQQIVGGTIRPWTDADQWITLVTETGSNIGFQRDPNYVAPQWPDGLPQQAHLDFEVEDLAVGEQALLAIGARKADFQPSPEEWLVFFDPAGHPFCLVTPS